MQQRSWHLSGSTQGAKPHRRGSSSQCSNCHTPGTCRPSTAGNDAAHALGPLPQAHPLLKIAATGAPFYSIGYEWLQAPAQVCDELLCRDAGNTGAAYACMQPRSVSSRCSLVAVSEGSSDHPCEHWQYPGSSSLCRPATRCHTLCMHTCRQRLSALDFESRSTAQVFPARRSKCACRRSGCPCRAHTVMNTTGMPGARSSFCHASVYLVARTLL